MNRFRRGVGAAALLAISRFALGAAPTPAPSLAPPRAPVATSISPADLTRLPKDIVTELILDASGSMKAKLGKQTKLFQAKRVLKAFMTQATGENMVVGLRVYGMKEKDCKDSRLVFDFGQKGSEAVASAREEIAPEGYGKTPLALSLEKAAEDLKKHAGKPRRVIVVSDGIESCGGDPCKIAAKLKRELDIRIYVVGYGVGASDREQLKCLSDLSGGKYWDADSLDSLLDALKSLSDPRKNLLVKSPEPLGVSEVWQDGRRIKEFVSSLGTHVEVNQKLEVRVRLQPTFTFKDVVVAPKEIKTLEVKGTGTVNVLFKDQLFVITLLDPQGKPVATFSSDTPTQVPAGVYKVKATSPPFADTLLEDLTVVPGGKYEQRVAGFGGLQLDSGKDQPPGGPFGMYVFDDIKKLDLGSYLTDTPLVLPESRYVIKTVGNAILKNVYPDKGTVKRIPIPPAGQTVTFARKEKPDPNEPKGPKMVDEMSAAELAEKFKQMQSEGK